ncbi:MAG: DMT family transporter [Chloroflexota bacterium]
MNRRTGFMLAFGSYLMYSMNSPIARQAFLDGMEPNTLLAYRFTIGAVLFHLTLLFTNLGRAKEGERPLDRSGVLIGVLSGSLNGLAIYFYFHSLDLLPASFVSVLGIGAYIVMTITLLTLFGEAFSWVKGARLVLGITGIWLLIGPSGEIGSQGVLLLLMGSFLFALHMISMQWYLSEYNTWAMAAIVVTTTAVLLVGIWLVQGVQTGSLNFAIPSLWSWIAVIFLAVFSSWIGRFFSYRAISILGTGELALMTPLETLLAITWSVLFLGEWLEQAQWLGAVLIVASVGLVGFKWLLESFSSRKKVAAAD